ncbi:hypothetical protein LSAT2_024819 [Lamellibrachia satsuma]|nr:hypothetical protein LSAT2_024819 [Lamellibrachia satsuma]
MSETEIADDFTKPLNNIQDFRILFDCSDRSIGPKLDTGTTYVTAHRIVTNKDHDNVTCSDTCRCCNGRCHGVGLVHRGRGRRVF